MTAATAERLGARASSRRAPHVPAVRCAIYTRKSTEEGLEQAFNTLHAQREAAEAFIHSQKHEGWVALPEPYDDGGFTGGSMDRPALARLLKDIEAGKVDCVVVYKVDRLSRSLLDFAKMVSVFEKHRVGFVSVTQQFNTSQSMGRLTLNVLLSFAQFEREVIAERTRDKIAATRRKGKWSGGAPVLGYDVDKERMKLVVNPGEAERVRAIFTVFESERSLIKTARLLNERGWTTKRWTTRGGREVGGRAWDKGNLAGLLSNVLYAGCVRYKKEVHPGEQEGIVEREVFDRVQALLKGNGRSGGANGRRTPGALLAGLLRCGACGCAMVHSHTSKGTRAYRYYVCSHAQKRGASACPSGPVPAAEIERFVVERVRAMGSDPDLLDATVERLRERRAEARAQAAGGTTPADADGWDDTAARRALAGFDAGWDELTQSQRRGALRGLVRGVAYDGGKGTVSVTLNPGGVIAPASAVEEAVCV